MSSFEKHAKDVAKSVYTAINQQSRELQARQQYPDRLVAELDTQIIEFTEQVRMLRAARQRATFDIGLSQEYSTPTPSVANAT
ncbi:hypothetical protein EC988_005303, partial [Linderina pennispora]